MAGHFEVIFSGEIYAAVDPVKVRADMARIFRQPAEKVHLLFDGRTWVLKDGLDKPTAERYQVELAKIGVISELRDKSPTYSEKKETDPHAQSQNFTLEEIAISRMKCPDCGYEQLEADYCARCGVSIAVAKAKAKVKAKEDEVIQARIRALREGGDKAPAAPPAAAAPRAPMMQQETTAEFRGQPRKSSSPLLWVIATLVVFAGAGALLVQQGIIVLNV